MERDYRLFHQKCNALVQQLPIDAGDLYTRLYSDYAISHLRVDKNREEALKMIKRTALFMDLPHPGGRDVRGENDFAALRLIVVIYELYDKLDDEARALVHQFFHQRDFTSMYGSENHVFMMRVARYLAAQFYNDDFIQFGLTAQQVLETDKKYIIDFIRFRAKYGVGEFNSAYLAIDVAMCAMLKEYAKDAQVKAIAQMGVDLIFIEALHNTDKNGYFAGAAGRSYGFCSVCDGAPYSLKETYIDMKPSTEPDFIEVPVIPDEFLVNAYLDRRFPMEVFEQKHLHSMYAWRSDTPDYKHIDKLFKAGSISKYTYLSQKYSIGAICRQDEYPVDDTGDHVYAHHQQVEWSMIIPGETEKTSTKLFTSHPGNTDQHRFWTGDLGCCCSHAYSTKDTLLTIYNIEKPDQFEYTHMYIECEKYDKIITMPDRVFLKKGDVNVFIYIAAPYRIDKENNQLISEGRKNAYVFRVETDCDFDAFCQKYTNAAVLFDRDTMRLEFDGLFLTEEANGRIGQPEKYHYGFVYDSPWVKAKWGEGVIRIIDGEKTMVLDFNNIERYTE